MKKATLILAAVIMATIFSSSTTHAQDVKGKTFVNAGIGLGTYGLSGTGGLPITISAEHGITDKISAGIYFGFVSRKYAYYGDSKYSYKAIGIRGSYHLNEALNVTDPKLDLYGGLSIFHRSFTWKYETIYGKTKSTGGDLMVGIHAGGRYMFAEKVGAFAELTYGFTPLQLGITAKF